MRENSSLTKNEKNCLIMTRATYFNANIGPSQSSLRYAVNLYLDVGRVTILRNFTVYVSIFGTWLPSSLLGGGAGSAPKNEMFHKYLDQMARLPDWGVKNNWAACLKQHPGGLARLRLSVPGYIALLAALDVLSHLPVRVDGYVALLAVLSCVGPATTGNPQSAAFLTLVLAEAAPLALIRCSLPCLGRLQHSHDGKTMTVRSRIHLAIGE